MSKSQGHWESLIESGEIFRPFRDLPQPHLKAIINEFHHITSHSPSTTRHNLFSPRRHRKHEYKMDRRCFKREGPNGEKHVLSDQMPQNSMPSRESHTEETLRGTDEESEAPPKPVTTSPRKIKARLNRRATGKRRSLRSRVPATPISLMPTSLRPLKRGAPMNSSVATKITRLGSQDNSHLPTNATPKNVSSTTAQRKYFQSV